MAKCRKFVLANKLQGFPKPSDFSIVEEPIPTLKDKDVHFEAVAISVDPYMRIMVNLVEVGTKMNGEQVAKVVESRHPGYHVGDLVIGFFGWQTHYVGNPDEVMSPFGDKRKPYLLPDLQGLSPSLALGALGMPGNTAYFGLLEICEPKSGKTLVMSGAAGAVGSHVGQIGKIIGCKVIGFVGSDEKKDILTKELNFDHAFNYKKISVADALKIAAPEGVDYYFDNVGGEMSYEVLKTMNDFGRVAICGAVSTYNDQSPTLVPAVQLPMIMKQIRMEGFIVYRWQNRWFEGVNKNIQWVKEGKLICKEHVTHGFEKTAEAFIGMLQGNNIGKAIVMI